MTTVLVAARRGATRARLEGIVGGARGLRLVVAPPALPLDRQIREARPDVTLVDLEDGPLEAVSGIGGAALVVLAEAPRRLLRDGRPPRGPVRAVLPQDAGSGEILAAIEAVAAGLVALHPEALTVLPARAARPAGAEVDPAQPLTAREIEVLGMLAEGLGNKIIAARLGISAHTAKFHVASILAKLDAGSRTEAVSIGMRRGLVVI